VEVAAAATIWGMFACFLLFPLLGLPARLQRAAMALLVAELVAVLTWGFASDTCFERPCSPVAEAARTAAGVDIPLLALALVTFAVARGLRAHRREQRAAGIRARPGGARRSRAASGAQAASAGPPRRGRTYRTEGPR